MEKICQLQDPLEDPGTDHINAKKTTRRKDLQLQADTPPVLSHSGRHRRRRRKEEGRPKFTSQGRPPLKATVERISWEGERERRVNQLSKCFTCPVNLTE
jgi:hypothetical protein